MTRKVIGKRGSGRRRWTVLLALVGAVGAAVLYIAGAQAVNATGAFELDGNAVSASGDTGDGSDDWDRVCREVVSSDCSTEATTQTEDPKSTARTWLDASANLTIFTGGGSKDPQDVSDWLWKPKDTVPDKDTLEHAFAARYSLNSSSNCPGPGGDTTGATKCEVIFFGMDRFANDGDAQLGLWFFQNPIGLTNTASQGGFKFSGVHRNGDLLLISNFSNGGTTSTISAYFWDTSCTKAANNDPQPGQCAAANLRLQAKSTNANCATSASNANFCGIVNSTNGTVAPWPYTDKNGNSTYLQGEFYEGGVNLSGLGIGDQCFSSIAAESRASTSPTSVLKDFVLGGFGQCTTTLETTAQFTAGTTIGGGTVSSATDKATLTVNGTATWGGTLKFYLCGPIATGTCDANGVLVTDLTVSNSGNQPFESSTAMLTSAGRYCWFAKFTPDAATAAKGVPEATDDGSGSTPNKECFTVAEVTPSLTTQAVASPVDFGQAVQDNATLSGAATEPGTNGGNATYPSINATNGQFAGTIEFRLKGPAATGCGNDATGTGTNPQTVNVDTTTGNKAYGPVSFTPGSPGRYSWQATYTNTGSANNNSPVTHNAGCDQTAEEVVVRQVPTTTTTRQSVFPQDKAVITATAGGNLAGTLRFTLHDSLAECQGRTDIRYDSGNIAVSGASPQSGSTNNTTYRIVDGTTHYWNVSYVSTNQAQLGSSSACTETTAVTYAGNDTGITLP
jgi:hypothetical protein